MRGLVPGLALLWGCASGGEFPGDGGDEGHDGAAGADAPVDSVIALPADAGVGLDVTALPDAHPPDAAPCVGGDLSQVNAANGHCYLLFTGDRDFGPAETTCESFGGHLATIGDLAENEFVRAFVGGRTVFIGGTDRVTEMSWAWVTNEIWAFTYWDSGEPNDDGTEDCAALKGGDGGRWVDTECGSGRDYVCERD